MHEGFANAARNAIIAMIFQPPLKSQDQPLSYRYNVSASLC